MKVRKRPVEVEAFQWDGTEASALVIMNWAYDHGVQIWYRQDIHPDTEEALPTYHLTIHTLEGDMIARPGYWIIKGAEDEFWGVEPGIFEKTYESSTDALVRIGRILIDHREYPTGSPNCYCGWRPQLSLNDTMADRGQHMGHVADVILAYETP